MRPSIAKKPPGRGPGWGRTRRRACAPGPSGSTRSTAPGGSASGGADSRTTLSSGLRHREDQRKEVSSRTRLSSDDLETVRVDIGSARMCRRTTVPRGTREAGSLRSRSLAVLGAATDSAAQTASSQIHRCCPDLWDAGAMLVELRLRNFRRFEDHIVPFRDQTVIVGANNAGKSTIVEAVRLVSLVANRFRNLTYAAVPHWLEEPVGSRGVTPSLRDLNTDLAQVFHQYQDPPAVIEARFSSKAEIHVYIGPDSAIFAVVIAADGKVVLTKSQAAAVEVTRVAIQPQVAPLSREERVLDIETIRRGLDSPLAPSHFRNQLAHLPAGHYQRFVELAESTWPGLQIRELVQLPGEPLALMVRDGSFVGEAATMGHGLQMWLQVIWFLARNEASPTIVLDEPDVYLHADLQRKLMRLVQAGRSQVIVATHSVEIMAEVPPSAILTVASNRRRSNWLTNLKGVQRVIDAIGGVHNIQVARLGTARRCLLLEGGDDLAFLKSVHDLLLPVAESLGTIPYMEAGGWDGWQRVIGAAQMLRNSAGDAITAYAIFDSDWHEPQVILDRYDEAERHNIRLHIWTRKEIENFLLVPAAIQRVIDRQSTSRHDVPNVAEVEERIVELATAMLEDITDDCSNDYLRVHRDVAVPKANRWARNYVSSRLSEDGGLLSVAPGKKLFEALSAWSDEVCGATFGSVAIARELRQEEIADELRSVTLAIARHQALPAADQWAHRV
jgi:hypothetical protein